MEVESKKQLQRNSFMQMAPHAILVLGLIVNTNSRQKNKTFYTSEVRMMYLFIKFIDRLFNMNTNMFNFKFHLHIKTMAC